MSRLSPTDVVLAALRVLWFALPLAMGPALGEALAGRAGSVRALVTIVAWAGWVVVLIATLVPRASSLSVVRIGIPGSLATAAWAAGPGRADPDLATGALAVVVAGAAVAVAFAPVVSDAFVTGSAYGSERRFALRCPPALAALGLLTWVAVSAGAIAGPLLLAAEEWVVGGILLLIGAVVVVAGVRSLHQLSRRWLVFVPSGLVVHDPVARPDAVMAPRPLIDSLGPARSDEGALDLSLGATGLSLVLTTSESLPVTVRRGRAELETRPATRIAFTPVRPAAVLAEAASRRIPVH